jgi:hypothetical protein
VNVGRRLRLTILFGAIFAGLAASGYGFYCYRYPYGYTHCCDKILCFSLQDYAEQHDGWFPKGEATPQASLSLLYRLNQALVNTLCGKTVPESVVRPILESGNLLSPETCGWSYVEGLRKDDDSRLAIFWDRVGLGHFGERLSDGGHWVGFVNGFIEYVPGDQWEQFQAEQARMRAGLKRKE